MNITSLAILISLHGKLEEVTPGTIWHIAQKLETAGNISVEQLDCIRRDRVQLANEYNAFIVDYKRGNGDRYAHMVLHPETIKAEWHAKRNTVIRGQLAPSFCIERG